MKRLLLSLVAIVCLMPQSRAEEGMWLVPLIEQNMKDMKSKGLELFPQRHISAIQHNGSAVSNAVVQFGNGYSGAVISPDGLLITNSNCAYSYINSISTIDNNLLTTGFWSKAKGDEIPVPGLSVSFVRLMSNVTAEVIKGIDDVANRDNNEYIIEGNKNGLLAYYKNIYKGNNYKFSIANYFEGEFYVLTITEVFQDVRLVGVPPQNISKSGDVSTNWQWPNYSGDFTLFRVYTAPDGSPAAYSSSNVPYKTKSFLNVAGDSYKAGDFAMTLGFPASTQRYMSDSELNFFVQTKIKPLVDMKGSLLGIMEKGMSQNKEVEFKYGPKYNTQLNAYTRSKAIAEGIEKYGVSAAKERDAKFQAWLDNGAARKKQYGNVLQVMSNYYNMHLKYSQAREYIYEAFIGNVDLLSITQRVNTFRQANTLTVKSKATLAAIVSNYYKSYDAALDRAMAYEAIKILIEKVPADLLPAEFKYDLDVNYKGNIKAYVDYLYDRSAFSSANVFMDQWELKGANRWEEDPAIKLLTSVQKVYRAFDAPSVNTNDNGAMFNAYKTAYTGYMRGLRDLGIITYPDAARTMRLTYGAVNGYVVPGGSKLEPYTTLDGMIAERKEAGSELPAEFTKLYANKAYADYSVNDTMKVNFLTTTDISTGNSGGPMLNAKGDIIGLVLDNNREGLVGDILYNSDSNRTINVDIHYILYIMDKYAHAHNILDEITIIDYTNVAQAAALE